MQRRLAMEEQSATVHRANKTSPTSALTLGEYHASHLNYFLHLEFWNYGSSMILQ
jgi:hypothetical protein